MGEFIHVTVRLFGPAADWAGQDTLEYVLNPPATLATLIELMAARYPRLASGSSFIRYAVGGEYADPGRPLRDGDEVAVIPPVAGGTNEAADPDSSHPDDLVRLTREPIDVRELYNRVTHPTCGAVATFEGIVRAETSNHGPLVALDYSAYEEMALRLMRDLRTQARGQFEIHEAAIVHRLGRLRIGDCSIAIVVAAPHRDAAFAACRWIIEAVKKDVPIWKKEIWEGGRSSWVIPDPPAGSSDTAARGE